ncbi:prepilin-type N-terminal cleavage/methylation domain-containing protein [Phenylobacterium sp.]|uniref:prepilin-type N-terminal cleavage/methylation domain-containing protein n=1 Tax=Phenylobacterium sp. TaxID=1871053 RepID=UPI002C773497|nr:prepilin-type N-terminal cleavage/methylation domain-containing protein [Phenylobacterium sp.]HLZ77172.1 prepilin-type N-terminal cleavage/methylation domain-containing protein [Phenylobacterium sp.]
MNDDGYTLVETLVALAILALAVGGVTSGLSVFERQQQRVARQVSDTQALRSVQASLERLLATQGPDRSDQPTQLAGSETSLQFNCGGGQPCQAQLIAPAAPASLALQLSDNGQVRQLALNTTGPAHFSYESELGVSTTWPPPGNVRQHLRTIAIIRDGDGAPASLVRARLWQEEPVTCVFDVVSGDCR